MKTPTFLLAAALVALAACDRKPDEKLPLTSDALPNLPLPPSPELIRRSGSADALALTFRTNAEVEPLASYYRSVLSSGSWRLVSEGKDNTGAIVLHAVQDGPPMWVRIWFEEGQGTLVQLSGALTKVKK
ncbi:MAG: hypothetical protein MUC69_11620 [Gemmatimonadales bacterium]|jgi:hypothetical protein|nr:hypothetical protein [Gemmatimonadales bacterium]